MLKLIGVLLISGNLTVAVETDAGFVEKSFPNTDAGAEKLIAFAERTLGPKEPPIQIVYSWADDRETESPLLERFAKLGIKTAVVGPEELRTFAQKKAISAKSPTSVALAFKEKFPFLFRKKAT